MTSPWPELPTGSHPVLQNEYVCAFAIELGPGRPRLSVAMPSVVYVLRVDSEEKLPGIGEQEQARLHIGSAHYLEPGVDWISKGMGVEVVCILLAWKRVDGDQAVADDAAGTVKSDHQNAHNGKECVGRIMVGEGPPVVALVGGSGVGKSTVAQILLENKVVCSQHSA